MDTEQVACQKSLRCMCYDITGMLIINRINDIRIPVSFPEVVFKRAVRILLSFNHDANCEYWAYNWIKTDMTIKRAKAGLSADVLPSDVLPHLQRFLSGPFTRQIN